VNGIIWIFQDRTTGGLIARREPHYYQYIMDPVLGEEVVILTMGESCDCPQWEAVWTDRGRLFGSYRNQVFDISHLSTADGTTSSASGCSTTTSGSTSLNTY